MLWWFLTDHMCNVMHRMHMLLHSQNYRHMWLTSPWNAGTFSPCECISCAPDPLSLICRGRGYFLMQGVMKGVPWSHFAQLLWLALQSLFCVRLPVCAHGTSACFCNVWVVMLSCWWCVWLLFSAFGCAGIQHAAIVSTRCTLIHASRLHAHALVLKLHWCEWAFQMLAFQFNAGLFTS